MPTRVSTPKSVTRAKRLPEPACHGPPENSIIATVIGEGGSGGALAIGVCDQLNMLQYSTYSVISPEGCASILWKTADKAPDAAEAMGITAERLKGLGIVDQGDWRAIGRCAQ